MAYFERDGKRIDPSSQDGGAFAEDIMRRPDPSVALVLEYGDEVELVSPLERQYSVIVGKHRWDQTLNVMPMLGPGGHVRFSDDPGLEDTVAEGTCAEVTELLSGALDALSLTREVVVPISNWIAAFAHPDVTSEPPPQPVSTRAKVAGVAFDRGALRRRRQAKDLTQSALADTAWITARTLRAWELGEQCPTSLHLRMLAIALDCLPCDLVTPGRPAMAG